LQRILIVANYFPHPLNHATAIDTRGHIQSLRSIGFSVDLVATVNSIPSEEDIRVMSREVEHVSIVERRWNWATTLGLSPLAVRSRAALSAIPLEGEYDGVLLESEFVAAILDNPSLRAKKIILRVNNNEARFFTELSKNTRGLLLRTLHRVEAAKFQWLSPRMMSRCDALWFVSDYEMKEHVKAYPAHAGKSAFVPPRVEIEAMRQQSLEGQKVLFIGTLIFANNLRGVEWYVSGVHPSLCDIPGYSLVLAGNTKGPNGAIIRLVGSQPKIDLYQNPIDLHDLYRNAAVFINPVSHGTGIKVKIIHAIQAGVPIVTTSNGIEGTGLIHEKHALVADSAQGFAASIRRLLSDKRMAKEMAAAAQDFVARKYDQERIIKEIFSMS
jgi:glycosyltransferase involved in cell wall biosynthesis